MADLKLDIARMIMRTRYELQLEAEASTVHGEQMSDMEREGYIKRIDDLLDGLESLLNANVKMGERIEKLEQIAKDYEELKAENARLKGELAMRKRAQHGKGSEKPKDDSSSDEKTKDDDENDYIENGSRNDIPPVEEPEEEDATSSKYEKRYMWVIVNLTTKVCYYLFGRRKREVIEKFLGDFQGTLMTDAYNAYAYFNKLDGCTHACCWAHVRRIFWSALKDYKDLFAQEYINKIGILYKVELESILLHRTEAEVLEARQLESIPILNELNQESSLLLAKVKSKELKISSKLEKALNYMRNHWKELIAYIDIGNVLIDNNCCERAVRPFTNLRKSFGGFSSELGGEVAAAWLTFVESCKLQKKAALEVFNGYFQRIAEGRRDYDLITEEVLC